MSESSHDEPRNLLLPPQPLPQFAQPIRPPVDPDLPGTIPPETTDPRQPSLEQPPSPASPIPSDARDATPTRTSSRGGVDNAAVAHLIIGLLTMVVGLVAWGVSKRGLELRRPERDELDDVAEPAARILARHADVSALHPDLADGVQIGAALTEYVLSEPLSRAYQPIPAQPEELDQ